jgi:hypothetical protein
MGGKDESSEDLPMINEILYIQEARLSDIDGKTHIRRI